MQDTRRRLRYVSPHCMMHTWCTEHPDHATTAVNQPQHMFSICCNNIREMYTWDLLICVILTFLQLKAIIISCITEDILSLLRFGSMLWLSSSCLMKVSSAHIIYCTSTLICCHMSKRKDITLKNARYCFAYNIITSVKYSVLRIYSGLFSSGNILIILLGKKAICMISGQISELFLVGVLLFPSFRLFLFLWQRRTDQNSSTPCETLSILAVNATDANATVAQPHLAAILEKTLRCSLQQILMFSCRLWNSACIVLCATPMLLILRWCSRI